MKDAEIIEALYGLAGHHGGAIVRHQGAGKPSLLFGDFGTTMSKPGGQFHQLLMMA